MSILDTPRQRVIAMAAVASPPELRFWRGKDVVPEDVLRTAQGPVGSQELGRTAGVLLVLAYIAVGIALRRASWMTDHRCDQLRWFTFKVLFPIYLLRTLWSIGLSLDFVTVLPLSLGFHVLWFVLSQQLSTFTPEAKEVQSESGQPHVVLTGWALLMAQGENMAFTYPLLAEASPQPVESLAGAMMWDLGANIWLCQGFLWGIATLYLPQVQAGSYQAIRAPETAGEEEDCTSDLMESTFQSLMGNLPRSWASGAKDVAIKAVTDSILLRACLAGICFNLLRIPLPWIVDAALLQIGALCKAFLYLLVGLYADFNISYADCRFIAATLAQRFAAQIALAVLLIEAVPLPSLTCRNALVVTIFSPGPSVLMHILAEVGYGQHLVKLCVTSSLVNTVLCLLIQNALLQYLPG